jgi:predicted nucleotidyltransferase
MPFPDFNENGDLPVGIYKATLRKVIDYFGEGSLQRRLIARRLEKIYFSAKATGRVLRFIVYGSFVTGKENPNDIDIFILMEDSFNPDEVFGKSRLVFNHLATQKYEGASVFWGTKSGIIGDIDDFIASWQIKRDLTRRGIVEVEIND